MKKIITVFLILAILLLANIKKLESTNTGCMITFKDNTGYYIEF